MVSWDWNDCGPYLSPSAIDFVSDASIIPSLHSAQSGFFPPRAHVGMTLRSRGRFSEKGGVLRRKRSWCYLAVSEKPFRHWPGKRWFKDNGALFRCYFKGASLVRAHCWRSQCILPAKLRIVLIYCMASCVTFRSCQWLIRCSWEICMYVNLNCNNCGNLPLRLFNRS